ncbi:unnamed protein product, partial [Mesorhabditis belari]|uniref:Uncharacterized protein n=1 Tax=Mesorhabditis belari TaxID=2138241 RepID=A0AAF3EHY1_9BILA
MREHKSARLDSRHFSTLGGRPVRKRAWQGLSAIDVFSSSGKEVKRPKASTSRISTPRNVAKNDGKNLQSGGRAKKEMEWRR